MSQPTVLIVSDDAEFSGAISGRWQAERILPAFTLMSGDLCRGLSEDTFDLAIVGAVHDSFLPAVLESLNTLEKPVLLVRGDADAAIKDQPARVTVLHRYEGWTEMVVRLAVEVLRRAEAQDRLRRSEQANVTLEREAALGRYIAEMRHNLNNALTSVLGNAELLLLEGQPHSPQSRAQVETIRNMALRIHEILQRFSSLEKELTVVARESRARGKAHTAGAGW
ncbi:MAG TPA: histidine kinase dimerization/phospho-acceptor domain-containing protein [Terriglobales bacterium]